ncbi:MAG TPA: acyl carrier protein [Nakamurella sp.]
MAPNELLDDVAATLAAIGGVDPAEVTPDRSLSDLDIDSMALVEIVVSLEDRFGLLIADDAWSQFTTVGDVLDHLERAGVGASGTTA